MIVKSIFCQSDLTAVSVFFDSLFFEGKGALGDKKCRERSSFPAVLLNSSLYVFGDKMFWLDMRFNLFASIYIAAK